MPSLQSIVAHLRRAVRPVIGRIVGVPLHEHATAAQDDRPSRELLREIAELRVRNVFGRRRVVDPGGGVVVSMTTHGDRVPFSWVALESIARGTALPARLILILDQPDAARPLSRPLRRLVRRGLEIMPAAPGLRVHAKYWPYVESVPDHQLPLTVSDDDMVYPPEWLSVLVAAHRDRPTLVHGFRVHEMQCSDGALWPYHLWMPATGTAPSFAHFATGVSGQILPPSLLNRLRERGTGFLSATPSADDIWINATAVQLGIRTAQVVERSANFPFVPATQASGLYQTNVAGRENDVQLAAALRAEDVALICEDFSRIQAARQG